MNAPASRAIPLRLERRFALALMVIGTLALVPVALVERASGEMAADAYLVNVASRQRMLSRRVVRFTRQATDRRLSAAERNLADHALRVSLSEWTDAERELADVEIDSAGTVALAETHRELTAMMASSAEALRPVVSASDSAAVSDALRRLRQSDDRFLPAMERTVQAFQRRAEVHDVRVTAVRRAGLVVLLVSFALTWLFILSPAARLVGRTLDDLQASNASLDAALVDAQAATRMKAEFLATMSHELRTPLNAVIGLSGLLAETKLDERQHRFADTINASGEALLHVINDILDFSKIEAGRVELESVEFDLRELVESTVETLALRADGRGLDLVALITPDVPDVVRGDAGRIRQVLTNFLGNALKFTEKGSVIVRVTVPAPGRVRLEVSDTGIGISPATLEHLFTAFTQADSSTTRRFGGTGLGLSISRRLIELTGGRVGAESVEGSGSTFWFEVPLPTIASAEATGPTPIVGRGLRVLVVDDLAANRMVVTHALARWKADVVEGASATDALNLVAADQAAGKPFTVVIVDWQMPGVDGIEFATRLRADPAHYGTPKLVLLSSFSRGQQGADEARAAGFDAWLAKPVRLRALRGTIRRVLGVQAVADAADVQPPTRARWHARALVADDNPVNTMVLQSMLRRFGLRADTVADGHEALVALERGAYDLVFLDVHMPVMDGLSAARQIRDDETHRDGHHTPLIACTASVLDADIEACRAAGMDDFIPKPVPLWMLQTLLERWLGAARDGG